MKKKSENVDIKGMVKFKPQTISMLHSELQKEGEHESASISAIKS